MNGVQGTFDRRGARAIRLAARPPARFTSLLASRAGPEFHHLKITEKWSRQWGVPQTKEAVQLLLDTGREEAFRLDPQAETAELLLA